MSHQLRIQSLSRLMVAFSTITMIAVPCWVIWYWATFSDRLPALQAQWPNTLFSMQNITPASLVLAAMVSLASASVLVFALWQLRSLFLLFKRGEVFSAATTQRLNAFAKALFISAVLTPITTGLLSVILTWGNPEGKRSLIFTLGSSELALLLFSATFLVITRIFREGQRLTQENAEFV